MIPRARLPQDLTLGHRRLGLTTYADPPFGAASASSLMIGSCRSDEPVLYVRPAGHPLPICPWASAPLRLLPVHVPQGNLRCCCESFLYGDVRGERALCRT